MITILAYFTDSAARDRYITSGARDNPTLIRLDDGVLSHDERAKIADAGSYVNAAGTRVLALADRRAEPTFLRGWEAAFVVDGVASPISDWRNVKDRMNVKAHIMRAIERSVRVNP